MNRDRIAALVSLVAALLAGTGLPSKLGMTPQLVTVIGGLVVGFAATFRATMEMIAAWRMNLLRRIRGEEPLPVAPNWRDIVGAFLGVMAIGLGIEGVAVDQLDPDALAGLSSICAAAFAWQRGGGGGPTPPAMTGLVLLVLLVCACNADRGTTATVAFAILPALLWLAHQWVERRRP